MKTQIAVRVADEVWIATALLHLEHSEKTEFTVQEIVRRAAREHLHDRLRPGVQVHASSHCVANRAPNPGRYRMLYAPTKRTRRLFCLQDDSHPGRRGKITPDPAEIPSKYRYLLDWYKAKYQQGRAERKRPYGSILGLAGLGKEIWKGVDPDAYVQGLRAGWK